MLVLKHQPIKNDILNDFEDGHKPFVRALVCVCVGSQEERQTYEKAEHRNKLQQKGDEPGLKVKVALLTFF